MKRILSLLALALVIGGSGLPLEQADASSFAYCSHYASQGVCGDAETSLGDFLTTLGVEDDNYYTESGFGTSGDYIYFNSKYFTYYIPSYLLEDQFLIDGVSGTVSTSDWTNYDENSNLIWDPIEDYGDFFDEVYEYYSGSFDMTWESGTERMRVEFGYYDSGVLGYYTRDANDDPYIFISLGYTDGVSLEDGGTLWSYYEDTVESTIVHEMFHAVENGYVDMDYISYNSFAEGAAVAMQSKFHSISAEDYLWFDDDSSLHYPNRSVFGSTEHGDASTYGSFLWYSYLHQEFGKDFFNDALEAFSDISMSAYADAEYSDWFSYLAVSEALEKQGSTVEDAYVGFSIQNYDKDNYTDGDALREVEVLSDHEDISGSESVSSSDAPHLFSSNYIHFDTSDREGYLVLDFLGDSSASYDLTFLPIAKHSVDYDYVSTFYSDLGEGGSVYFPIEGYDEMIVIVSPVNSTDLSASDVFNDVTYPYSYAYGYEDSIPDDVLSSEGNTDGTSSSSGIFSDVDSNDTNYEAISYLKDNGIVGGYADGSFKPENPLNRAELLKILVEGAGISPDSTQYANCFPDVTTDWYAKYVCYAKEQGWIEGYPDGTFLPSSYVNKVEAVKMLLEVFGVETTEPSSSPYSDVPTSEWYAKYIVKAQELGLLEESGTYSPASSITRGGVSENIYRLLIQL